MKKGERTRYHLLETATNIVGKEGIEFLTARNLADRANVSLGIINHYFPKFLEIFAEITEYIFNIHRPSVRNNSLPTPEERLYFQIEANFTVSVLNYPEQYKALLLSYYYMGVNKRITKFLREELKGSIGDTEKYLLEAIQSRGKRAIDAQGFAQSIAEQNEGGLVFCSMLKNKKEKLAYSKAHLERQKKQIELYLSSLPSI